MNDSKITHVYKPYRAVKQLVSQLIPASIWFEVEPHPNNRWAITVKNEKGAVDALNHAAKESGATVVELDLILHNSVMPLTGGVHGEQVCQNRR